MNSMWSIITPAYIFFLSLLVKASVYCFSLAPDIGLSNAERAPAANLENGARSVVAGT